ncbi:MAG: hypothetical protein OXG27_13830 [Chloroflexi bacterium]|nr:hypothetical protein [Chloroflexota bacterium]
MSDSVGPDSAPQADTARVIGVLDGARRPGAGPDVELVRMLEMLDGTESSVTLALSALLADADPH